MPVKLIHTRRFGDDRGWFIETYHRPRLAAAGIADEFVQDNHSLSRLAGTIRGIHFQTPPHAQAKLVRCSRGRMIDYAVDLRAGSPTYGRHVAAELSADNGDQLYIPVGFGHAFVTLEPDTEVIYKVSDIYVPETDGGIRWDCPTIAIDWPLPSTGPVLSDKDMRLPVLADWVSPFAYDDEPLGALWNGETMRILVTGGAGFIGSALIRHLIGETGHEVLNLDKLTYAGVLSSLAPIDGSPRYRFVQGDICDAGLVGELLADFQPDVIAHLAAESHVDRSIDGPGEFIQTNLVGTFTMLAQALGYWQGLDGERKAAFRFHHISTDEVFGSLGEDGYFTETTAYDPRSPYSASKAGSDHLVRAWGHTYGLPVLVTNCSNNYGPYHFPELIPLIIIRALAGEALPVYGDGSNVRDWLFVEDHARALRTVFEAGSPGETYNVGGNSERTNIEVVRAICATLDRMSPRADGKSYADQISFVTDRPGHDHRYAIDAAKIRDTLGWEPQVTFEQGIEQTVGWYLDNRGWWGDILAGRYDTGRLGLAKA